MKENAARRPPVDDHPNRGPHTECQVDHGGSGVPRHCRRGCKWPCPDASIDPRSSAAGLTPEAAQRIEFVKHFIRWGIGGWFTARDGERDYFRDALWTIENVEPREWTCCPLCQEVVCDDDCPLYAVRDEAGIWVGSKGASDAD